MLELSPSDPIIKTYLGDLRRLKDYEVSHELGLKAPFHNLLDAAARRRGWTLVQELSTYSGGKRVVPDGTLRDEFKLPRGWWEAKDTGDNLAAEVQKKIKAGYPTRNTIFEDTRTAVLYQDRGELGEFALNEPVKIAALLSRFFSHDESDEREFQQAMDEFKSRIPDLAQSLREHINEAHEKNRKFMAAFSGFVSLCRASLNPELSEENVDEMLIQHLLTERLMRRLFQNEEFTQRNAIAAEVEKVIVALASPSFTKAAFLEKLDPYYRAIEREGANLSHFTEKQDFLNSVYEQFFQKFSPNTADTHGIVYTPREIVEFMCKSVEEALSEEFGFTLASPEVVIVDPSTGTGNFIVNLIERMPVKALPDAYKNRLFANEVMLLPYYVASLNIEHAYYERVKQYESFEGLCFVDTLDMAGQHELFGADNTTRVHRENSAAITVIIGNPPYNVGQKSENDNNQNRKYKKLDARVRDTYAKDSKATNKNALADMYVKFFRWASDRLGDRDGIVCFVSNNGFLRGIAFDGFRKRLSNEFQRVDHFDLLGNARTSGERRRQEGGNVFDDQIRTGIGITLAVRKRARRRQIRYFVVPQYWKAAQKRNILVELGSGSKVLWQMLEPDDRNTWLVPEHADEYGKNPSMSEIFSLASNGIKTNRDEVVYDWNRDVLVARMKRFIADYNAEVSRHKADPEAAWPESMKWSRDLKQDALRGRAGRYDEEKLRPALYRPFTKRWLFFDRIMNEEIYQWSTIHGPVIVISDIGWRAPVFTALMTDMIADLHLCAAIDAHQCFPLSHLTDAAVARFREHYNDTSIGREDVFHYIYALLHHPGYRERYAANLRRDLPRIPFAPDFDAFRSAGKELARWHVRYESLEPWPLEEIVNERVPYSQRVTKMKLSADRRSAQVNDSLTLSGIPEEAFDYRLGSRSALEWVIDQYQVKGESDPNREDDPGYIVQLVGQVVRASFETVRIVKALPDYRTDQNVAVG